jgi:hypothetical protein
MLIKTLRRVRAGLAPVVVALASTDKGKLRRWPGRIDPIAAEVIGSVKVRSGLTGGITATDDAVWVRAQEPFLRRVDPETLEVVEQIDAGGGVTVAFGSVWASAPDDQVVHSLRR